MFHLLMQTVSYTPHTVPAMNATSEQTTAVMATVAAVDRLFSGVGIKSEDRKAEKATCSSICNSS